MKALNLNPSHLKQLEISKKRTLCERVNAFSGKTIRIYRRVNTSFLDPSQQVLQASVKDWCVLMRGGERLVKG